jgi:hypothetical protein
MTSWTGFADFSDSSIFTSKQQFGQKKLFALASSQAPFGLSRSFPKTFFLHNGGLSAAQ